MADEEEFETGEEEDMEEEEDEEELDQSNALDSSHLVSKPVSFHKLPSYLFTNYREVGEEATWTLSSAKPGNGAEALRNGDEQTYWQSDGSQPHKITIQFHRRAALMELAMNCNHKLDESYTPKRIRVLAGNTNDDLELVVEVDMEPSGWVLIPLFHAKTRRALRAFVLQIEIIAMLQNGRDTHVRGVCLFGPRSVMDAQQPRQQAAAGSTLNTPQLSRTSQAPFAAAAAASQPSFLDLTLPLH